MSGREDEEHKGLVVAREAEVFTKRQGTYTVHRTILSAQARTMSVATGGSTGRAVQVSHRCATQSSPPANSNSLRCTALHNGPLRCHSGRKKFARRSDEEVALTVTFADCTALTAICLTMRHLLMCLASNLHGTTLWDELQ